MVKSKLLLFERPAKYLDPALSEKAGEKIHIGTDITWNYKNSLNFTMSMKKLFFF